MGKFSHAAFAFLRRLRFVRAGRYHGKNGFDELSHKRGVMFRPTYFDPHMRFPPFEDKFLSFLRPFLVGPIVPPAAKKALGAAALAAAAYAVRARL